MLQTDVDRLNKEKSSAEIMIFKVDRKLPNFNAYVISHLPAKLMCGV